MKARLMIPIQQPARRSNTIGTLFVVVIGVFVLAGGAIAEDSWGYDIAHDLMSPYCPGRTLATCPSPQAAELVQWIVMQEAAGATREQVIEMLVERFGDDILGAPKAEGINLLAYVFPVLGFATFGAIAFFVLRRIVAGGGRAEIEATTPGTTSMTAGSGDLEGQPLQIDDGDDLARIVDDDLEVRA